MPKEAFPYACPAGSILDAGDYGAALDELLPRWGIHTDFVDGLLEGRQPQQDVHAATRMLQVPLAIYEAARTGRAVAPESIA